MDYLLLALGTRQLMATLVSGLLYHPPLAVAAQQALHVLLNGSPSDYCRQAGCCCCCCRGAAAGCCGLLLLRG